MTKKQSIISLIASLALVFLTSGLSSLLSKNGMESYPNLAKPPLAPPGIVFPIVWGILFFLMVISSWLILKELTQTFSIKGALLSTPLLLYFAQLLVNFFWSILLAGFCRIFKPRCLDIKLINQLYPAIFYAASNACGKRKELFVVFR